MKRFDVVASWDPETQVWWGSNDDLPIATEAPTLAESEARAIEIGQEMAEINGLVAPGERVEIRIIKKTVAA
jgi:predicted RNase H-like HicB family nuclease